MEGFTEITVLVEGALDHEEAVTTDLADAAVERLRTQYMGTPGMVEIYALPHPHEQGIECECIQYVTDHTPTVEIMPTVSHQANATVAQRAVEVDQMIGIGLRNGAFTPSEGERHNPTRPATGPLAQRRIDWRDSLYIAVDRLRDAEVQRAQAFHPSSRPLTVAYPSVRVFITEHDDNAQVILEGVVAGMRAAGLPDTATTNFIDRAVGQPDFEHFMSVCHSTVTLVLQ